MKIYAALFVEDEQVLISIVRKEGNMRKADLLGSYPNIAPTDTIVQEFFICKTLKRAKELENITLGTYTCGIKKELAQDPSALMNFLKNTMERISKTPANNLPESVCFDYAEVSTRVFLINKNGVPRLITAIEPLLVIDEDN